MPCAFRACFGQACKAIQLLCRFPCDPSKGFARRDLNRAWHLYDYVNYVTHTHTCLHAHAGRHHAHANTHAQHAKIARQQAKNSQVRCTTLLA